MRKTYQTDLSDAEWARIEPQLPTLNSAGSNFADIVLRHPSRYSNPLPYYEKPDKPDIDEGKSHK